MRSRKGLRRLVLIGLIALLSVTAMFLLLPRKRKWGIVNRTILNFSRYRGLAPYLIAQSKLETNDLKSHVYDVDNNLFGMKLPHSREYLGTQGLKAPENDGTFYQHFVTDTKSLRDMFIWLDYVKFPKSVANVELFNDELYKRSYYGKSETRKQSYLDNLKYWMK